MRLIDLDPVWMMCDGLRVGFTFNCPLQKPFRQVCLTDEMSVEWQLAWFINNHPGITVQGCQPGNVWSIEGGIDEAKFETMTVSQSIDGSEGGLWHGYILNGKIVGGLPH